MTGPREALVHAAVYNERELHLGDGSDCYACRRHVDAVLHNIARADPEACLANNKQTRLAGLIPWLWVAFAAGVFVTVLLAMVARIGWSLA